MSSDQNPDYLLYIGDEQLPSYIRDYFGSHETRVHILTNSVQWNFTWVLMTHGRCTSRIPHKLPYELHFFETCKPPLKLPSKPTSGSNSVGLLFTVTTSQYFSIGLLLGVFPFPSSQSPPE